MKTKEQLKVMITNEYKNACQGIKDNGAEFERDQYATKDGYLYEARKEYEEAVEKYKKSVDEYLLMTSVFDDQAIVCSQALCDYARENGELGFVDWAKRNGKLKSFDKIVTRSVTDLWKWVDGLHDDYLKSLDAYNAKKREMSEAEKKRRDGQDAISKLRALGLTPEEIMEMALATKNA